MSTIVVAVLSLVIDHVGTEDNAIVFDHPSVRPFVPLYLLNQLTFVLDPLRVYGR